MQILINIIVSSTLYLLIASSFSVIYFTSRFFHISHAIIITLGAYFSFLLFKQLSVPIWITVPISILFSILVGILIELFIYKPLRSKKTSQLLLLIVSIGVYLVLQNTISIIWGDNPKIIRTGEIKVGYEILGSFITNIQVLTIIVSILLFSTFLLFNKYNKIGRNIRATASNIELSNIVGINSNRVLLWCFGIGSGLAAVAGILAASDTGLTPTMGFKLLFYGVVAMIIGGIGSTWGLIGGALLLATSQHLTAFFIDSKWMDAMTYIILILFLIWKPLGFSGLRLKKVEI